MYEGPGCGHERDRWGEWGWLAVLKGASSGEVMSSGAMSRASGWWRIGIITGGYGCLGAGIKHDILVWREILDRKSVV